MPTQQPEEKFTRIYEPAAANPFKYTTTVRHQGNVIMFVMDDRQHIFYSVLNFERSGIDSPLDVNFWDTDPIALRFPTELGQVGARAAGLHTIPTVLKNGAVVTGDAFVEPDEIDYFASTTARLSADAPFVVLSDGEYLYVFRQAIAAGASDRNIYVKDSEDNDVAVVDHTLLVDRFIYRNGQLASKLEVRFQRSRRIDQPASRKDTLGNTDLENKPFYEPTLELDFIRNLRDGNFAIQLLPTALPQVQRWQIFAYNDASRRIDSFNIERAADGLFNTQGTRYYTSPDPRYQNDVFERAPGTDPFTGEALIPRISKAGFAEFALNFNGVTDDAVIVDFDGAQDNALPFPSTAFSTECWIKTTRRDGAIASYVQTDTPDAFLITDPGNLVITVLGESTGLTGISVADGTWRHLAVTWHSDGGELTILVDGKPVNPDGLPALAAGQALPGEGVLCIGQRLALDSGALAKSDSYHGLMDEFRLWNRLRGAGEITDEMHYRLIGNESDLVGYWRFDEGSGNSINDQSDNAYHGALDGEEPAQEDNTLDEERLNASALHFDGSREEAHHQYTPFSGFPSDAFTIEMWMKVEGDHDKMVPLSYANEDNDDAVYLFFDGDLRLSIYGQYSGPSKLDSQLRDGGWHHVAVTWENNTGRPKLYLDGADETPNTWATINLDHPILDGGSLVLGLEQEANGSFDQPFYGDLNEVRIWNRVRSQAEIQAEMNLRVDAFRTDLVFCMHNDVSSRWTHSDAPIGDHPGVRRSSFAFEGREIGAGMAAQFYFQQEQMAGGYSAEESKPMKRNARLLLAASTVPATDDGTEDYVAALDFGITKEGKLAQVPDLINLDLIDRPGGSLGGESIDYLLEKLRQLKEEQTLHISQIENTLDALDYDDNQIAYETAADIQEALETVDEEIDNLGGDPGGSGEEERYQFDAVFSQAPGLTQDAGFVFLRGDACLRTNTAGSALEGYPRPIAEEWPSLPAGWTSDLDAAYAPVANVIEFFKGAERIVYTITEITDADSGESSIIHEATEPAPFNTTWPDLPDTFHDDLDAVTLIDANLVGLFKGNAYLTVNMGDPSDISAVQLLRDAWPGLPPSWYDDSDENREPGFNAVANGQFAERAYLVWRDYEFVEYVRNDDEVGPSGDPALVDDDTWPGVIQLFGVEAALDEEEIRLQRFYYLKEKLLQLDENMMRIEETKADIHSDIFLPMPMVHFDPDGHWTTGALLGFAWTADAPQLFESINGRLNLYFRGKKDQFFVAYFSVITGRALYAADTDSDETVDLISRITGADGDQLSITIENADTDGTCTVTIYHTDLDIQETWLNVSCEARTFAQTINGLSDTYDYTSNAHAYPGYFKPEDGSRLVVVIDNDATGNVQPGVLSPPNTPSDSSQWFAASPGNAISLLTQGAYAGADGAADWPLEKASAKGDVSMEAWINPVHNSDDTARIITHHTADSSYTMGLRKTASSQTAKSFDGSTGDAIIIPMDNFPTEALTIEFWAQAGDPVSNRSGTLFSFASLNEDGSLLDSNQFVLSNHKNFNLQIGGLTTGDTDVNALDFSADQLQSLHDNLIHPWFRRYMLDIWNDAVGLSSWHHFAITWRGPQDGDTENGGQVEIYKDGLRQYAGTLAPEVVMPASGVLVFGQRQTSAGGGFDPQYALRGTMDELRIWNVARTRNEIVETMNSSLGGNEPGLAGFWRLEGNLAEDLSQNNNTGTVQASNEDFSLTTSPVQHFVGFAGIGNRYVETLETIPPNTWQHLAAVYNQSYALEFDGINDRVDCGSDITLDLNGDLTIEAILTLDDRAEDRGIITRGRLADGSDERVPYALRINKNGRLVFAFEDESGRVKTITGPEKSFHLEWRYHWAGFPYRFPTFVEKDVPVLAPGQTYRVSVTREKKRDTQTKKDSDGNITSVNPREWWDIHFYIDGMPAGYVRYEGTVGSNSQPVEIGIAYDSATLQAAYFKGKISEVRLWNTARDGGDIGGTESHDAGHSIKGNEKGLVSWWRFEENEGNIALDSKSANHGTRKGPKWVKNPDPIASKIYMYINGESSATQNTGASILGDEQLTLGACLDDGVKEQFHGWLDEIRIWRVARTQEQIQDNLFRRLLGERDQLIAHFDTDVPEASVLYDQSGRGLNLELVQGERLLSSAPISEETAAVRNALAAVKNNFHDQTETRPGVQEYGDVQYDVDGNMIGVMKRAYSYIKAGRWHLVTGFKVGDLELEWIGQAQYDPQLIGFIEGAPPVPSENLTIRQPDRGQNYEKASSVELKDAESTVQSYSITTDRGVDTSISLKGGVGFKSKTLAGIGVASTVEEVNSTLGVKGNMETSNSWLSEQMVGAGQTTNRLSRLDLLGAWEDTDAVRYPKMGRRYLPKNVGFALVQSETADVFAMRLKHPDPLRRIVVGLRMQPNPDIPKDWNIIIFPLNNRYVKQGTLDGKVGFDTDVDYPNALEYSSNVSYFKPVEAYAMKNRIEREREELNLIYKHYDASPAGASGLALGAGIGGGVGLYMGGPIAGVALALAGASVGSAIAGATAKKTLPDLSRRNMVNTYVWTADGGLFAETEQAMDMKQEVAGGSFSLSGMAGLYADINTAISKVALKFELEAMMGGHLNLNNQKSEESTTSFEVAVDLDVERDIHVQDEAHAALVGKDAVFDADGNPIKAPGKVDAYRFMTFYLRPDKEHFKDFKNKVIDQEWLNSNDSNAVALSQAISKENGAPWRVLHRVTYVSRVLPEIDADEATATDEALKAANIQSNYELIRKIEPYVINKTGSYTEFAAAVRDTIRRHLPELVSAEDDIVEYMALYFQVFE